MDLEQVWNKMAEEDDDWKRMTTDEVNGESEIVLFHISKIVS